MSCEYCIPGVDNCHHKQEEVVYAPLATRQEIEKGISEGRSWRWKSKYGGEWSRWYEPQTELVWIKGIEYELAPLPHTPDTPPQADPVEHPTHYTSHPSGVECSTITRHMSFNIGNVFKYLWRCDHKDNRLQDLRKAKWYLEDEIKLEESKQAGGK